MSYTRMMPCDSEDGRSEQRKASEPGASAAHHGSSVVGCGDGLEPLLPRCVPAHTSKREEKCTAALKQRFWM